MADPASHSWIGYFNWLTAWKCLAGAHTKWQKIARYNRPAWSASAHGECFGGCLSPEWGWRAHAGCSGSPSACLPF